jgi:radical SAM superfamily enzyme YgiQ (UPF0313 family)
MNEHYDIVLLTPTLEEAARRRLLPHTVGQRDHLGLGYLASCIRQHGGRVLLLDCLARKLTPRDLAKTLADVTFSLAGVYVYQQHAADARMTCAVLKARCPAAPVVLGGVDATLSHCHWLATCDDVDGVLLGEGEASVPSLLEVTAGARDLAEVPGMCVRGRMAPSLPTPCLDDLPWPVRPSLDQGAKECSIVTTRGCVFRCVFCAVPEFTRVGTLARLRARSPGAVVNELEYLVRGRKVEYVSFVDDLFFGIGQRGVERCHHLIAEMERARLPLEFGITCRTDDVEQDLFARLKQVGLRTVYFGLESLVDDELMGFSKANCVARNLNAIQVCQSLGLRFHIGFIMLHPKVTLEHVEANIRSLHKQHLWSYALKHRLLTRRMYIFRGTPAAQAYGDAVLGGDYVFADPRINDYFAIAKRLEHQAFFMLLRPDELRRVRSQAPVFTPYAGRQAPTELPQEFVDAAYATLDRWFESVRLGEQTFATLSESTYE